MRRLRKCEKYKTETKKTSAERRAAHSTKCFKTWRTEVSGHKIKNFTLEPRLAKTDRIAQGKAGVK